MSGVDVLGHLASMEFIPVGVLDAIAELIAADEEYDAAKEARFRLRSIEHPEGFHDGGILADHFEANERFRVADKRRSAALAACKPARGAEGDSHA